MVIKAYPKLRECGSCQKCCEGWLSGQAYAAEFHIGRPCAYLGKHGCTIYANRPASPCQTFICTWKHNITIPEEFRPDQIGLILVGRTLDNESYIRGIYATNQAVKSEVYVTLKQWAKEKNITIVLDRDNVLKPPPKARRWRLSVYGPSENIRKYFAKNFDLY